MDKSKPVLCPVCGQKTHTHVRSDTFLLRFPLFCPKCKRESVISVRDGKIVQVK